MARKHVDPRVGLAAPKGSLFFREIDSKFTWLKRKVKAIPLIVKTLLLSSSFFFTLRVSMIS